MFNQRKVMNTLSSLSIILTLPILLFAQPESSGLTNFKPVEITGDAQPFVDGINAGFAFENDEIILNAPDGWRLEKISCTSNDVFPNKYFIQKKDQNGNLLPPDNGDIYSIEFSFVNNSTVIGNLTYGKPAASGKYQSTETLMENFLKEFQSWYFAELQNLYKCKIKIGNVDADRVFFTYDSPGWSDKADGRNYTRHFKGWGYFFKTEDYLYSLTAVSDYKPAEDIDFILNWLLKGLSFRDKANRETVVLKDRGISITAKARLDLIKSPISLAFLDNLDQGVEFIWCYWQPEYRAIPLKNSGFYNEWLKNAWDYIINTGQQSGWSNFQKSEITYRNQPASKYSCDMGNNMVFNEIHIWHNSIHYIIRYTHKAENVIDEKTLEKLIKLRDFNYDLPIMSTKDSHLGNIIWHLSSGSSQDKTYEQE